MKKAFLAAISGLVLGAAATPVVADAPKPTMRDLVNGSSDPFERLPPLMQEDILLNVADVCDDWKSDSGTVCTDNERQQLRRSLSQLYLDARDGREQDVLGAYRRRITAVFGRVPQNLDRIRNNQAVQLVEELCEAYAARDGGTCSDGQRAFLIKLFVSELEKGAPASIEDANERRDTLSHGIANILSQDPALAPERDGPVIIAAEFGAGRGTSAPVAAAELCALLSQYNGVPCTQEKQDAIEAMFVRNDARAPARNAAEERRRVAEYMQEIRTIFFSEEVTLPRSTSPSRPFHRVF